MAETHDTIDRLLAEFRGYAAGMPPSYHVTMSWHDFRRMLDRIEAAHKRERGDAAKWRKALVRFYEWAILDLNENAWMGDSSGNYKKLIDAMAKEIAAALAAPPRNCDRFASAEEAWDAYDEWADSYKAQGKTEPFNEVGWLFAPATETEGGAK